MDEEMMKAGFKIVYGRRRTWVTTYENLPLHTTHPIKENTPKKIKPSIPSDYADVNYYNRMKKRKKTIRELCYNNFVAPDCCMVTLTFDEKNSAGKYTDLQASHHEFKKFIQRMNSHYDDFNYIATFSRQQNGNWHYHVICNFSGGVTNEDISGLWKNGYTYLTRIEDESCFKNCMKYLINNMQESAEDVKNRHGYLCSKSLEHDKVVRSWRVEDNEDYDEAEKRVYAANRKILYETRNHLRVKEEHVDEKTGEIKVNHIPGMKFDNMMKNAGYESWDSIFTHLISQADFSDKFRPLRKAVPKQPRRKKRKK